MMKQIFVMDLHSRERIWDACHRSTKSVDDNEERSEIV